MKIRQLSDLIDSNDIDDEVCVLLKRQRTKLIMEDDKFNDIPKQDEFVEIHDEGTIN